MGTVSTSLPSDGTTIDASDVNTPINAILSEFNGNIDDNNIKSGANINGSKLLASSIPGSKFDSSTQGGYTVGVLPAVSSVTENGNRSADITFASTVASILTPGMRIRTSRTVAAPTQSTSLNGTTQYYSKATPNKLTFTDDFVVSAWVKLSSYAAGTIASRYNGTSGWQLLINGSGQVVLNGFNAGAANYSQVVSYQSLPLNKWVHVTAQLDMSAFTATTTTSYVMIDGTDVPCLVGRGGTNPTALIQAGDLQIGAANATSFLPGAIAQVAIYNAKVTQANIRLTKNQALSGSETSLASAYSFNSVITDLNTTTPNDLTANGSAVATNAASPFCTDANGVAAGTYDWAIVTKVATTVATVQYPEGCAIPTSGGISTVDYSGVKSPFGMPVGQSRWRVQTILKTDSVTTSNATWGAFLSGGYALAVPTGEWSLGYDITFFQSSTTRVGFSLSSTALTGLAEGAEPSIEYTTRLNSAAASVNYPARYTSKPQSLSAAATYVMYTIGATTNPGINGSSIPAILFADCAHL